MSKSLLDLLKQKEIDKIRLEKFLKEQIEKEKQLKTIKETKELKIEEEIQPENFSEPIETNKEEIKPKRGRKPKNREYLVIEGESEVKEEETEEQE